MAKTTYSHHISYWSDWRPSSVTTTNNSTWKSTTKAVWSSSSKSSWSSSSSSSSKNNTSYNFIDPSVLQDQHMGMSNEDIAKKWWWTDANWNSWSSTAWWTKVLQALNKNNRVYWTGWYTEYNPSTWLYDNIETLVIKIILMLIIIINLNEWMMRLLGKKLLNY